MAITTFVGRYNRKQNNTDQIWNTNTSEYNILLITIWTVEIYSVNIAVTKPNAAAMTLSYILHLAFHPSSMSDVF